MNFLYLVFVSIFMMIFFKIMVSFYHLLMVLLLLESFMLLNMLSFSCMYSMTTLSSSFIFIFFSFAVCEACVAVSLLIFYSRITGSDLVNYNKLIMG